MGTGGPFPRSKARPERDADHSLTSNAEVKNENELYLLSLLAPPWHVVGQLYILFGSKRSWPDSKMAYYAGIRLDGLRKTTKNLTIDGLRAEISSRDLPNMQQGYPRLLASQYCVYTFISFIIFLSLSAFLHPCKDLGRLTHVMYP
jgi:hypothetical protein